MTDDIIACGNGCKEADASGVLQPRLTTDGRAICEPCCDRLWKALDHLPDNYVRLYAEILPGSVERNPETKATKGVYAPAPLRIDPIDLYDERHYLIGGSLPIENVRGVVGVLQRWANLIRIQQGGDTIPEPTLTSEVSRLTGSFDYMVRQPWAPNAFKAIMATQRDVKDAIGIYRSRSRAACPVLIHNEEAGTAEACDGNLSLVSGGVRCLLCGAFWTNLQMEQLSALIRADGGRVTADVAIIEVAEKTGVTVTAEQIRAWASRGHIARVPDSANSGVGRPNALYDLDSIIAHVERQSA